MFILLMIMDSKDENSKRLYDLIPRQYRNLRMDCGVGAFTDFGVPPSLSTLKSVGKPDVTVARSWKFREEIKLGRHMAS
jgi:hypothetical protein